MARGFGGTSGVGATDAISTGLTTNGTQRSWAVRFVRNSTGGNGEGRLFARGTVEWIQSISASEMRFDRSFSLTDGRWTFPVSLGVETSLIVRHDGSSNINAPSAFINGVSATLTQAQMPMGSLRTTSSALQIGNVSGGNRVLDGTVAEFAVWDEVIPDDLAIAISKGATPLIHLRNLIYYAPLIRDVVDLKGARSQTVTGTAVQPHPRVSYLNSTSSPFTSSQPSNSLIVSAALATEAPAVNSTVAAQSTAAIALSTNVPTLSISTSAGVSTSGALVTAAPTLNTAVLVQTPAAIALSTNAPTLAATVQSQSSLNGVLATSVPQLAIAAQTQSTAQIALSLPPPELSATIVFGNVTVLGIALATDAPTVSGVVASSVTGAIALSTVAPTLNGAIAAQGLTAIALSTGAPVVSGSAAITPTAAIALSTTAPTVAGVAVARIEATAALSIESAVAAATAQVNTGAIAALSAAVPSLNAVVEPLNAINAAIALTLSAPQLQASATAQVSLQLAASVPVPLLSASVGTVEVAIAHISAHLSHLSSSVSLTRLSVTAQLDNPH